MYRTIQNLDTKELNMEKIKITFSQARKRREDMIDLAKALAWGITLSALMALALWGILTHL